MATKPPHTGDFMKTCQSVRLSSLLLATIAVVSGCSRDTGEATRSQTSQAAGDTTEKLIEQAMRRPQCTEMFMETADTLQGLMKDMNFAARRHAALEEALGDSMLPEAPEVHDCQPLIIPNQGNGRYGPMVTAFAHGSLQATTNYTLRPVWVATITKSGSEDFTDLNLTEEKNCLFLYKPLSGNWRSWIVPTTKPTCATEPPPSTAPNGTHELDVHRASQDGVPYKPWGIRLIDTGMTYYIGLQCPGAWCIVGKNIDTTKIGTLHDARGDYQRLAGRGGGSPLALAGLILPTPFGFLHQQPGDYAQKQHVADMIFFGTDSTERQVYAEKFGITSGILPDTVEIWLKWLGGDRYEFSLNTGWSKTISSMKGKPAVGMARWMWSSRDEDAWVQCATGCCGVDWP